jgi:TolB-like protein
MFCTLGIYSQENEKVVIESTYGDDIPQNIRDIFMNALTSGLTNSGRFTVLTNREEYIKKVAGEVQAQEYIDDNQQLELGRALGADYIIYTKIIMMGDQFFITFQMTEAKTGRSVPAPEPRLANISNLMETAMELAKDLASGKTSAGEQKIVSKEDIICSGCIDDEGVFTDGHMDHKDRATATWNDAISTCQNKGDGWRLPTINELKVIYRQQRILINAGSRPFQPTTYWTSSPRNNFSVFSLDFSDGSQTYISKSSQSTFRCVYNR